MPNATDSGQRYTTRAVISRLLTHMFASLMIAAGVNAKALQSYMGHGSIQVTFVDMYGKLMPGNEDEAARLLDRYLARESERAARVPRGSNNCQQPLPKWLSPSRL